MKLTLGQIAIVTMGQSPSSEYYNSNHNGLPFLQGCTTFGRLYPTYDIWSSFYNKEAFPGDILFTVRAPVGDVNMCKDHIAIGRGLASIKALNVLPKYLFYLLQANKHQFQFASSGTIYQSINRDKLLSVELNVHSPEDQRHIVGTIGSVDDLIEKNAQVSNKTMEHANLLFTAQSQKVGTQKLQGLISFVKGKKPELCSMQDGLLYLTIDSLTGNTDTIYSSSGIRCSSDDVLMVMDGASSGKVFIGFNGYVGSTLAKIVTDIPSSLVYLFLHNYQQNMMENTTGSAIPHADKGYIGELEIPMIKDQKVISELSNDLKVIQNLRKSNLMLAKIKKTLLEKYF